jgi:hypothetical protein
MTEQEFWGILAAMPEPKPVFFRVYHNDLGHVLFYSMEDLPGTYIEIDATTFMLRSKNVIVRNGQLVEVIRATSEKLQPTETGTPCHPSDVTVVVSENDPHTNWSKLTHEQN